MLRILLRTAADCLSLHGKDDRIGALAFLFGHKMRSLKVVGLGIFDIEFPV
jgi:hypothetical protein